MQYRRNNDVIFTESDGEKTLYHPRTGAFFKLNLVGDFIWSLLSELNTKEKLSQKVALNFDAEMWQVSTDVDKFIENLLDKELVVTKREVT